MSIIYGVDYGPLAGLIGEWEGDRGVDTSPEPDGVEVNPYFETIVFEAGGTATNAERQTLAVVPYKQVVKRKSDGEVFHHQVGYWVWDAATGQVIQSLNIPRAVSVLAGGEFEQSGSATVLSVATEAGGTEFGVLQSPFMAENAKTTGYNHTLTVDGDTLKYTETTHLFIYGKAFEHTDENTLTRVI
jgi:hypothetical protein